MKIYIAGKISGDKHYRRKFRKAERILKRKGHSVMSPAVLNDYPEFTWENYMDITEIMQECCNATYFLPDWKESRGSRIEFLKAKKLYHTIFFDIKDVPRAKKY